MRTKHIAAQVVFLAMVLMLNSAALAEIFQGIYPYDTLGDIKKKFPNATFSRVNAVWVTDQDAFLKMEGLGFSGTLYMAFTDSRPRFRQKQADEIERARLAEGMEDGDAKAKQLHTAQDTAALWKSFAEQTDEDALTINWLRWVPPTPIPLARYIVKYGKPEKAGFNEQTMEPNRSWEIKHGIVANLVGDSERVGFVDISFTKQEEIDACKRRFPKDSWGTVCK